MSCLTFKWVTNYQHGLRKTIKNENENLTRIAKIASSLEWFIELKRDKFLIHLDLDPVTLLMKQMTKITLLVWKFLRILAKKPWNLTLHSIPDLGEETELFGPSLA